MLQSEKHRIRKIKTMIDHTHSGEDLPTSNNKPKSTNNPSENYTQLLNNGHEIRPKNNKTNNVTIWLS